MARLIDSSVPDVKAAEIHLTMTGKLKFRLAYGWNAHFYQQSDIASVSVIDEDKYRSAGGAAAGAIIGGVLTGGIGLLAGAALGGRRQSRAAFVVVFKDGHHVAFEESKGAVVKSLAQIAQGEKARTMTAPPAQKATSKHGLHNRDDEQHQGSMGGVGRAELPVLEQKRAPYGAMAFWALVAVVGGGTWWVLRDDDNGVAVLMAGMAVVPILGLGLIFMIGSKLFGALRKK